MYAATSRCVQALRVLRLLRVGAQLLVAEREPEPALALALAFLQWAAVLHWLHPPLAWPQAPLQLYGAGAHDGGQPYRLLPYAVCAEARRRVLRLLQVPYRRVQPPRLQAPQQAQARAFL